MQGASAMIKEEVDSEDIADVVSRWTGIPVSKMMQSEKEKLLHLESELHTRVHLFSSVRQVSVRQSWPKRWRNICSTTRI